MQDTADFSDEAHPSRPLAYFITFTCYGTWLHGDAPGSVDREHREYGTPFLDPDAERRQANRRRLEQPPYQLDGPRRQLVLQAMREVCAYRGWRLLAAHVRCTHVHAVVQADVNPERVMNDWKAYATRALNNAQIDPSGRKRWTRHGSTRYLWKQEQVAGAVHYTLHEQGGPMAVFPESFASVPAGTANPAR